jgi:hypothetical protein
MRPLPISLGRVLDGKIDEPMDKKSILDDVLLDEVVFVSRVADGTVYRAPAKTVLWNFYREHDPKYQSMSGIVSFAQELVESGIAVGIAVLVEGEPVVKIGDAGDLE